MVKKWISLICIGLCPLLLCGQEEFYAKASVEEIEAEEVMEVTFYIRNLKGEFERPEFEPFGIVAGPMKSSSFQSINGEITQEYSFKYILRAPDEGFYLIPEAMLVTPEDTYYTEPIEVQVLPADGRPLPPSAAPKKRPDSTPSPSLEEILRSKKVKRF